MPQAFNNGAFLFGWPCEVVAWLQKICKGDIGPIRCLDSMETGDEWAQRWWMRICSTMKEIKVVDDARKRIVSIDAVAPNLPLHRNPQLWHLFAFQPIAAMPFPYISLLSFIVSNRDLVVTYLHLANQLSNGLRLTQAQVHLCRSLRLQLLLPFIFFLFVCFRSHQLLTHQTFIITFACWYVLGSLIFPTQKIKK